jgi:hypothetical protein
MFKDYSPWSSVIAALTHRALGDRQRARNKADVNRLFTVARKV